MMRAVRLHGANGSEDLAIDEVELRSPAEGEALVRVHAAALTRDELDYHFSETMKGVGASYYRISAVRADASGDPTGAQTVLSSPLGWLYMEAVGPNILVQAESLGPVTVGVENNLYLIPYHADHDWQDDQYHGLLNTAALADDRYLVMLEVFDTTGNKLR